MPGLLRSPPYVNIFEITVNLDDFPTILHSSKGALMTFTFPYCLVSAACKSWTARFEAWPSLPQLVLALSRCREVAVADWAKMGSMTFQTGAESRYHFHPDNLISSSQNNRRAFLLLTMGVTTPERPFYLMLKGCLANPQASLTWPDLLPHLCFPHPHFYPLSWKVQPVRSSLSRGRTRRTLRGHQYICGYEQLQCSPGVTWVSCPSCPYYERPSAFAYHQKSE